MKLFYDYDSTLNNLTAEWVEWINHRFNTEYKLSDVDTWEWFYEIGKKHDIDVFEWFKDHIPYDITKPFSSKPIDGAVEFVNESNTKTRHNNISILTATHCDTLIERKDTHIAHFFGDVDITHTDKKYHYAYNHEEDIPNLLLDDKPSSCVDWVKNGGIGMLYTKNGEYAYAKSDFKHENFYIVDTYDEVLMLIDKISSKLNIKDTEEFVIVDSLNKKILTDLVENEDISISGVDLSDCSNKELFTIDNYSPTLKEGLSFAAKDIKTHNQASKNIVDTFTTIKEKKDVSVKTEHKNKEKAKQTKLRP